MTTELKSFEVPYYNLNSQQLMLILDLSRSITYQHDSSTKIPKQKSMIVASWNFCVNKTKFKSTTLTSLLLENLRSTPNKYQLKYICFEDLKNMGRKVITILEVRILPWARPETPNVDKKTGGRKRSNGCMNCTYPKLSTQGSSLLRSVKFETNYN